MTLGFIGAGAIASAIVTGLRTSGDPPSRIVLSPRNAATASDLAARFPEVVVAESNQGVVDQCDTIVLSIRPNTAESLLQQLRFKESHVVISVVATFGLDRLCRMLAPARNVTRAVPLPSAAQRQSPTALYPADEAPLRLFRLVGRAFTVDTEEEFNALCTATAAIASYYAFAESIASWLVQRGVRPVPARDYVCRMLPSLEREAAQMPELGFRALAAAHATAGGLNEQFLNDLEAHDVFGTINHALDQVMLRLKATSC